MKRLVEGTHKLAAGDFSTRVTVTGGDELGRRRRILTSSPAPERNQQMRRDLMADISHELRTRWRCCAASWRRFRTGSGALPRVDSFSAGRGGYPHQAGGRPPSAVDVRRGALAYQKTSLDIITLLEVAAGAFRERFASRQLSIQVSPRSRR